MTQLPKHPRAGIPLSDEHRTKISESLKGRVFSDEHRGKIGATHKNRSMTPAAQLQYDALKLTNLGANNPMFGKQHTDEAKKAMSEKCKGIKKTAESNEKRSEALSGRPKPTKLCPHCQKECAVTVYPRYHGDKCKLNPLTVKGT